MTQSLERKIQQLLDAGESPSEKLAEALEGEPELRQAAVEMEQLDAVLGEWAAAPLDLDEDVFVRRIAQRLDEQLAPLEHDVTLPVAFDDEDSLRRSEDEHSGEFELSALTDQVSDRQVAAAAAPGFAQPPAMEPQPAGKVVRLEPKRSSSTWVFAAAAVVGLVAAGGIFMVSGEPANESVAMVQSEAAAPEMPDEYAPAPGVPSAAARGGNVGSIEPAGEAVALAEGESEEEVLAARPSSDPETAASATARYMETTTEDSIAPPAVVRRARMARGMASSAMLVRLESDSEPGPEASAKAMLVRRTHARVFGCFDTPPASVRARVWVDGRTGRVREVDVPSGGRPPEVECVRRAVRSVRFPVRDGVARYTTTLEYDR